MKTYGAFLVVCAAALACNGATSGSGSCAKVSPCGGSLTGTWTLTNACVSLSEPTTDAGTTCPGESIQVGSVALSGTITFNSDMTYSTNFDETTSTTAVFPSSCLTSGSVTLTCSDLVTALSSDDEEDGGTGETVNCTMSGSNCDCTLAISAQANDTGTYSTSGDTVTLTATGSTPTADTYCVQGNTLYVFSSDTTSGAMGTSSAELVATMQ
jgi:hypothetical protein